MKIKVLGAVEIWRGPERLHLVRRQLALIVGLLALEPSVLVHRDRLVDFLWPDDPPRRVHAVLQTRVSELRAALRGDKDDDARPVIESARGGYRLDVPAAAVDVDQFKSTVRTWRSCESEDQACEALRAALGLWRGPLFGSWLPGDIYATLSHSLESMRLTAAEDLFGLELRRGNALRIVDDVVALSAANPTREKLFAEQLLALYATGRGSEALHQYEHWRRSLRRDLGADPGAELQAIHRGILNDDVDVGAHSQTLLHVATDRDLAASSPLSAQRRNDAEVPRTLPPDLPDFTGRDKELRILTDALVRREGVSAAVAVSGPGGIGKSALCTRVGHALSNAFPDGQIYLNLHGFGSDAPLNPSAALVRLLRLLGVDGAAIPDSVDERAEQYRQLTAQRKLLIILDNAGSDDQVLPLLPGGPSCRTLINARTRIGASFGALAVGLGVLDVDDACVLVERVVGARRLADEPAAATELVRRCGGLPLALRIVAAKLASKPHWKVARFVRMLDDERSRLSQLSHAHLDVGTTISLSYSGLGEQEKTLLRRLCDLRIPDITLGVAAALLDEIPSIAEQVLENLFDVQLIDTAGQDSTGYARYRMHDLIRLFGRERAATEDAPGALSAARLRAFGSYLYIAEAAYRAIFGGDFVAVHSSAPRWDVGEDLMADVIAAPVRWFEVERMNIATVVARASADGEVAFCWDLACSTSPLFTLGTYVEERAALIFCALAVAESANDVRGEAAVRHRLGMLHADRKQFASAMREFERAVNLFEAAGDEHGCAIAHAFIGMTKRFVDEPVEAVHFYTRAVTGFQRSGDVGGEAFALRGIGQARMDQGDSVAADASFERALQLYRAVPGARISEAQVLFWRGILYTRQERHADAEPLFKEVLSIAREVGDRAGQAQAMRGIAICQHAQNDKESAAASLAEALQLLRRPTPAIVESQIMATVRELGYESVVRAGQAKPDRRLRKRLPPNG